MDGDGDLDLMECNLQISAGKGSHRLFRNDGAGTFTDVSQGQLPPRAATWAYSLAVVDVEGDGDPDLVLGNQGPKSLLLNDGQGRFSDGTTGRLPVDQDATYAIATSDLNGDGSQDLVLGNWTGLNRIYLNDGQGHFTDATGGTFLEAADATGALALGDVDSDGDPDLWVGNFGARLLFRNLTRHLHLPYLARPGRHHEWRFHVRPRPGAAARGVIPLIGTRPSRIPVPPFGFLGPQPAGLVVLPFLWIPSGQGAIAVAAPIPPVGALVGSSFLLQGLVVTNGSVHLTGMVAERVLDL
jgi:hypothetical protein